MKIMFTLMEECAQQFADHFKNASTTGVLEVELKDAMSRYTNDVIASTAFGLRCNSLEEKNNEFYLMGKAATDITPLRVLRFFSHTISPWLSEVSIGWPNKTSRNSRFFSFLRSR